MPCTRSASRDHVVTRAVGNIDDRPFGGWVLLAVPERRCLHLCRRLHQIGLCRRRAMAGSATAHRILYEDTALAAHWRRNRDCARDDELAIADCNSPRRG